MRDTSKFIENYLRTDTQYAIQIVGPWGIGKTFHYKAVLEEKIKTTPLLNNGNQTYTPIYVSLFGLRSVEDIQVRIFQEFLFHATLKKRKWYKPSHQRARIASRLIKLVFKGALLLGKINADSFFKGVNDTGKDILDTNKIVICFDDLERKSELFSIEELTGFINSLVDARVKLLIICNEDKIEGFSDYKEKIVGLTLDFNPEPTEVIKSIICSRYSGSHVYLDFLQNIQSLVVEVVKISGDNYRHLIFALDMLHNIYSMLKKDVLDLDVDFKDVLERQLLQIAKFSLTTAIEFKAGVISYDDHDEMNNGNFSIFDSLYETGEDSKSKRHRGKYYTPEGVSYCYYNSIFSYITGAAEFSVESFEREFKEINHLVRGVVSPQYKVYEELGYSNCFKLSEEEYISKVKQMIEYAKNGEYKLVDYLTIFDLATRFENLPDINSDDLVKLLSDGMSIAIRNLDEQSMETISDLNFHYDKPGTEIQKLIDFGKNLISSHLDKIRESKIAYVKEIIINDFNKFCDNYHDNDQFKELFNSTFLFSKVDPEVMAQKIVESTPEAIHFFSSLLKERHQVRGNYKFQEELLTLKDVGIRIEKVLEDTSKTMKRWTLKELGETINKLYSRK